MTDARPAFLERMREAALERINAITLRDRRLAVLAGFDQRSHIGHVVSLSPEDDDDADGGVFAVQVVHYRKGLNSISYTTVVRGNNDRRYFHTLAYAVLHALAQDTPGYETDLGTAAAYAGRVLGMAADHTYAD